MHGAPSGRCSEWVRLRHTTDNLDIGRPDRMEVIFDRQDRAAKLGATEPGPSQLEFIRPGGLYPTAFRPLSLLGLVQTRSGEEDATTPFTVATCTL